MSRFHSYLAVREHFSSWIHSYFKDQRLNLPQPRKQFLLDLTRTVRDLQDQGHAILLMLDANSALDSDDHLREFLGNLNLHDVHVNNPVPSTYIGLSARRIDYIFGCSGILPAISWQQGIPSYFEGPQSDHRSLFVDLNLSQLLVGDETNATVIPASPQQRWLISGNPKLVELYVETVPVYYKITRLKNGSIICLILTKIFREARLDAYWQHGTTIKAEPWKQQRLLWLWDPPNNKSGLHCCETRGWYSGIGNCVWGNWLTQRITPQPSLNGRDKYRRSIQTFSCQTDPLR